MAYLNTLRIARLAACMAVACVAFPCEAQDLQPRRWSHLPIRSNFGGGGYAYTCGDVALDPVLRAEDVKMEIHSVPLKYIRTFELLGRSARLDSMQVYQDAEWTGLVNGVPTTVDRSGWADTALRLAVNVIGAPPLSGAEFKEYLATTENETIVGMGLIVQFPTGQYFDDKLLNLGTNRYTFRPQLGVVQKRGKLSTELTVSSWIYTDNDQFFNGNYLEQNPLYTIQGHVDYTFIPGVWAGAGVGYGIGQESTINGISKNDQRENVAWLLSIGCPISPQVGLKFSYLGHRTLVDVGSNSDSYAVGISAFW